MSTTTTADESVANATGSTDTTTTSTASADQIAETPLTIDQPPFVPQTTIPDERAGVRRVSVGVDPSWRPAPVDPEPEDLKRAERRLEREQAEADGTSYKLEDGTEVHTTPEGKAEAEAKQREVDRKAKAKK